MGTLRKEIEKIREQRDFDLRTFKKTMVVIAPVTTILCTFAVKSGLGLLQGILIGTVILGTILFSAAGKIAGYDIEIKKLKQRLTDLKNKK